ncbi:alpha/beta hydrolase [Chromobacterium sphagni]|uniref:Serine aminopeptidase S33 domain-containing protein n=1 Tax=Chromobacterium sphagni TaxID=1903179 RepID=A0ABX3CDU6_9NEIS|nr:alpha/beta hydrolase [Chromobacterium sphagni]OHX20471.1 hypothetical protein BI344_08380 [Chromobacterium sphagni]
MRLAFFAALLAIVSSQALAAIGQPIDLDAPSGRISGSLLLPDRAAKPPVALIIAGSGAIDRDGNYPGPPDGRIDNLKQLAQALSDAGIASLRYDKRAIAASRAAGLDEGKLHFDDYVADAAGWIAKLRADPRFSSVMVIGHGEGALIGMLAAGKQPVAVFVSLNGPARNAADILRAQLKPRLPEHLAKASERILQALQQGREADNVPGPLMVVYRPSIQPYLISWFRYTPSQVVQSLRIPMLIVQGTADRQVDKQEALALHTAQPDSRLALINGMDHLLHGDGSSSRPVSQQDQAPPLAPELAGTIAGFLKQAAPAEK